VLRCGGELGVDAAHDLLRDALRPRRLVVRRRSRRRGQGGGGLGGREDRRGGAAHEGLARAEEVLLRADDAARADDA
jgi:hypothetical protein